MTDIKTYTLQIRHKGDRRYWDNMPIFCTIESTPEDFIKFTNGLIDADSSEAAPQIVEIRYTEDGSTQGHYIPGKARRYHFGYIEPPNYDRAAIHQMTTEALEEIEAGLINFINTNNQLKALKLSGMICEELKARQ